jgi:hypothetical protein
VVVRIGERRVPFLGKNELIADKRASGRPKDLLDVEALRALKPAGP